MTDRDQSQQDREAFEKWESQNFGRTITTTKIVVLPDPIRNTL